MPNNAGVTYEVACTGRGDWGEKSLPSQQIGSRRPVYHSQTNIDQSPRGIRPAIFVFQIRRISFLYLSVGNTQISLQPKNASPGPFKCLVLIINCLIMWERTYEGTVPAGAIGGARNRYRRNSLEAGAVYTYPRLTSVRVMGELTTGRRPVAFVFLLLLISVLGT